MQNHEDEFSVVLHKDNSEKYPSKVWRVFGRLTLQNGKIVEPKKTFCKLCYEQKKAICSYGDGTGTDSLLHHLQREHPGLASEPSKSNTLLDVWKQSVVGAATGRTDTPTSGRPKKFALARDLALWASEDLLPFSFVEGTGLQRFFLRKGVVRSKSEIPVRSTVSRGALDDAYEVLKAIVIKNLSRTSRFHVSTDIWTDRYRQLPYITIVIHYVDEDFRLKTVPLKTDAFPGPHTGPAILDEILSTLRDFDLDEGLMFAAISDAASNMVRGFKDYLHIRCADHRIHRALTADFYKTEIGTRVLKLRSQLMKVYRHLIYKKALVSKLAKEKAQEEYLEALIRAEEIEKTSSADDRYADLEEDDERSGGFDPKGLKADVPTRWGSVCRLFESAAASFGILNEVLMKSDSYDYLLSGRDIEEIRIIAKNYRVILDLMTLMQSSKKPTINMVVLGVIDIETTLQEMHDEARFERKTSEIAFQQELASTLKRCVSQRMRPFSKIELLAALLDPEQKNISKIREEVPGGDAAEILREAIENYAPRSALDDDVSIVEEPPSKQPRTSLIAKYSSTSNPSENISREIEMYLALPVVLNHNGAKTEQDKLLAWWSTNSAAYPSLCSLARIILSIPATSAEPERRFSAAGNALREKRCSLEPTTMAKTLFIHDNKNFLPDPLSRS